MTCLDRTDDAEVKAKILRLRSRVHWMQGSYREALGDTITGLHLLGVEVNPNPSRREADTMFEQVKNEVLAVGFEDILAIPKARDARTDLAIALLNDAGTNAYWSTGEGFADVIGLTVSTHVELYMSKLEYLLVEPRRFNWHYGKLIIYMTLHLS